MQKGNWVRHCCSAGKKKQKTNNWCRFSDAPNTEAITSENCIIGAIARQCHSQGSCSVSTTLSVRFHTSYPRDGNNIREASFVNLWPDQNSGAKNKTMNCNVCLRPTNELLQRRREKHIFYLFFLPG